MMDGGKMEIKQVSLLLLKQFIVVLRAGIV